MLSFLEELTREVHPRFGGVDVLVKIDDQVICDDRIARREKSDKAADEVLLARCHALTQVMDICREINLLDGPCIRDCLAVHLIKMWISHRSESQREARVKD